MEKKNSWETYGKKHLKKLEEISGIILICDNNVKEDEI